MNGVVRLAERWVVAALLAILPVGTAHAEDSPPPEAGLADGEGAELFEQHIRPVLVERCYQCHSAESETLQGGLRLDDPQAARAGGDSGPAIVPGKVGESLILQ